MILSEAKDIKLGSRQVEKVYRGSQLIWEYEGLPIGYQRCEYLESHGTEYINTGIVASYAKNLLYKIKFKPNSTKGASNDTGVIFGANSSWQTGAAFLIYDGIRYNCGTMIYVTNIDLNRIYEFYADNNRKSIDNAEETAVSGQNSGFISTPIFLFGLNRNGSFQSVTTSLVNVYNFSIFDSDGNKILSFIPCLDTDGIPCMYDTVSKQPFYNSGTGTFGYELA